MYDRKDIIGYCADVFKKNAETFGDLYPEAQSKGYVYQLEDNTQDWTTGFFYWNFMDMLRIDRKCGL